MRENPPPTTLPELPKLSDLTGLTCRCRYSCLSEMHDPRYIGLLYERDALTGGAPGERKCDGSSCRIVFARIPVALFD